MKLKKFYLLFICFLMLLSMTACGDFLDPYKNIFAGGAGSNSPEGPNNPENPGGGDDTGGGSDDANKEAFKAILNYRNISNSLGFYEYDHDGNNRAIRNDITRGILPGMVQFAQTHTINPKGNAALFLPSLIIKRSALLLFTPMDYVTPAVKDLSVEVSVNGEFKGSLKMKEPALIPQSDSIDASKPDVVYSKKAWTVEIPWNWVEPGMELAFKDNQNRTGILAASDIEYGAPAEGVFAFIRLGMLTDYRKSGSGYMMDDPARAMADYFQTVPFSKVVNVTYESRRLDRVIIANGTIYDINSPDESLRQSQSNGGMYEGDMRENVGKSQVSVGINMANYGIPTNDMSQSYNHQYYQMTTHLNQGLYKNGVHAHGLSGGNGIGTLMDTIGNEFSHEVGHAYGLGHFERPSGTPEWWSHHHSDSGWGYSAFMKRMRGNFFWNSNGNNAENNFKGLFNYNRDTMAGGEAKSSISKYTHLIGFTAMKAQNFLANKPIISEKSSTGYYKWDTTDNQFKEHSFSDQKGYKVLKPYKIGVPVITLLGGYDPKTFATTPTAVMYPYFRANWGNVYNLAEPDFSKTACWLEVDFAGGSKDRISLRATRHNNGHVNQFHVNIEEARKPRYAALYCSEPGKPAVMLDSQLIPTNLSPMNPPVVIGQEYGYSQAMNVEMAELENALVKYQHDPVVLLNAVDKDRLVFLYDNISELRPNTKKIADEYLSLLYKARYIEKFIDENKNAITTGNTAKVNELKKLYTESGIAEGENPAPKYESIKIDNKCITVTGKENSLVPKMETCSVDRNMKQLWILDSDGKFRSALYDNMCLESRNSNSAGLSLKDCSAGSNQQWLIEDVGGNKHRAKSVANRNYCMHFDVGQQLPVSWPCAFSPSSGETWNIPNKVFVPKYSTILLSSENSKIIYDIFN